MLPSNTWIFDSEVLIEDWLFVFKHRLTGERVIIANDNMAINEFIREHDPLLVGFNNKNYDQFIMKGCISGFANEEVKEINDFIIAGNNGWDCPLLRNNYVKLNQFDLMDDTQQGTSLKSFEAHMGMNIVESSISFDIDHALSDTEMNELIKYCIADVDATEKLLETRIAYLENKIALGKECNLPPEKALYMTNAKLTAEYLGAQPVRTNDERNYKYPENLLREYIPQEVFDFFDAWRDGQDVESIEIVVGGCPTKLGLGGIHGAIPTYCEESTDYRSIRNQDVASYYPNLMRVEGYCSRAIPNPQRYADTIARRVKAKKSGDKVTANALKLVLNTTYGAMLNQYNKLYDPLMGRSVCITGQLRLLELANHLVDECPSVKIIQLNTDGIMISIDEPDVPTYLEIVNEWQARTGFELEEDIIQKIYQKDVNNYVEVAKDGSLKCKGGMLVRGIAPAGAFKINNDNIIIAEALTQYLAYGTPVEDTINACNDPSKFMMIAKAGSKYSNSYQLFNGNKMNVQKVNRVYASKDERYGPLYKVHKQTKKAALIPGLPEHCIIDNENTLGIEVIDKDWYIKQARKQVNMFRGVKAPHARTTKKHMNEVLEILGGMNNGSS